jgi:lipopolysaccharide transport protein LptA
VSKPAIGRYKVAFFLGLAGAALGAGSSLGEVSPKTGLSIGVAPFERVGDLGGDVPDVSLMLARRLSTLGVSKVASPTDVGGTALADPDPRTAADQARRAGVSAVVVGRVTGLGGSLSIDARLRDGSSGAPVGRRVFVEVPKPRDLAAGVDQLASQVVEQANEAPLGAAPPPIATAAASAPAPPPAPAAAPRAEAPPVGAAPAADAAAKPPAPKVEKAQAQKAGSAAAAGFDSDAPITIKSDVLDVFEEGGKRRFVFAGNVRAKQADLAIRSEKLEAFYPPGGSQPERIVAIGSVTMKQAGRSARCAQATFYRKDDRIVCIGDVAEVEQGCDIVRGREIVFHTASQLLKVNGAADVRINPDAKGCGGPAAGTGQ